MGRRQRLCVKHDGHIQLCSLILSSAASSSGVREVMISRETHPKTKKIALGGQQGPRVLTA